MTPREKALEALSKLYSAALESEAEKLYASILNRALQHDRKE